MYIFCSRAAIDCVDIHEFWTKLLIDKSEIERIDITSLSIYVYICFLILHFNFVFNNI